VTLQNLPMKPREYPRLNPKGLLFTVGFLLARLAATLPKQAKQRVARLTLNMPFSSLAKFSIGSISRQPRTGDRWQDRPGEPGRISPAPEITLSLISHRPEGLGLVPEGRISLLHTCLLKWVRLSRYLRHRPARHTRQRLIRAISVSTGG